VGTFEIWYVQNYAETSIIMPGGWSLHPVKNRWAEFWQECTSESDLHP